MLDSFWATAVGRRGPRPCRRPEARWPAKAAAAKAPQAAATGTAEAPPGAAEAATGWSPSAKAAEARKCAGAVAAVGALTKVWEFASITPPTARPPKASPPDKAEEVGRCAIGGSLEDKGGGTVSHTFGKLMA
ncbi:unnamed protein product [Polarella glacialis]|uniref:Uncharacterized protein n=1 Tax=Polarella glacialis TaxID=89957 RepID=A0A813EY59_POLGL|nr:unnamed protein product [Polarella glacialis]CAE8606928.1 unnamed protein product [Polarella glacialis]